ncbi:hypothetical protein SY83_10600 [Paenibacillus swuensis]|uniref:Uncharacterized protein n=1 Tax=Paenibacillus swuensis TaxID=1178515 RepID=A0A172TIB7_9BACL|nr:stalk domain-containing protein [Paenibacillus swuensis]ANE46644.1 hypothetical protein SY83_10600 [Paenibacillus swuensis]
MKVWKKALATTLVCAAIALPGAASAGTATTQKDPLYEGVKTLQMHGATWVPLREIAMKLGYTVVVGTDGKATFQVVSQGSENNDLMSERLKYFIRVKANWKMVEANNKEFKIHMAPIAHMNKLYVTKQFADYYLKMPVDALAKQSVAQYEGT